MNRGPSWRAALLLAVVTLVAYAPALRGAFLWDDHDLIPDNALLDSPAGLWKIWTDSTSVPRTEQHHPLVQTTFWLEHRLWGDEPTGYHVVNVLLHAANALLAWSILARLGVPAAWLAGWLFALHPVHVESTAWIVERKDQLSTLFYLLAGLGYERFVRQASRRAWLLALGAFALAVLAKTMVLTFPIAVLIVLWWKRGRIVARDLLALVPFVLAGALLFFLSYHVLVHPRTLAERPQYLERIDASLAPSERVLVAGRAVCFYATKLVWPTRLSASYPLWRIDAGDLRQWLFPALVAATGLVLAGLVSRIGRGPLAGFLFYVVTLAPALGFFSFYLMAYTWVADRFQYLAALGPLALAAAGASGALAARSRWGTIARGALVLVLALLGGLTLDRCRDYRDLATLLEDAIAKGSSSARLHYYAALEHERADRVETALEHYRKAIEVDPEYYSAHLNLGARLLQRGSVDEAIPWLERAIALRPEEDSLGRNNLAVALAARGELERAIPLLEAALERRPEDEMARLNLGFFLLRQGRRIEAGEQFSRVLARNPGSERAAQGLRQAQTSPTSAGRPPARAE